MKKFDFARTYDPSGIDSLLRQDARIHKAQAMMANLTEQHESITKKIAELNEQQQSIETGAAIAEIDTSDAKAAAAQAKEIIAEQRQQAKAIQSEIKKLQNEKEEVALQQKGINLALARLNAERREIEKVEISKAWEVLHKNVSELQKQVYKQLEDANNLLQSVSFNALTGDFKRAVMKYYDGREFKTESDKTFWENAYYSFKGYEFSNVKSELQALVNRQKKISEIPTGSGLISE